MSNLLNLGNSKENGGIEKPSVLISLYLYLKKGIEYEKH